MHGTRRGKLCSRKHLHILLFFITFGCWPGWNGVERHVDEIIGVSFQVLRICLNPILLSRLGHPFDWIEGVFNRLSFLFWFRLFVPKK